MGRAGTRPGPAHGLPADPQTGPQHCAWWTVQCVCVRTRVGMGAPMLE